MMLNSSADVKHQNWYWAPISPASSPLAPPPDDALLKDASTLHQHSVVKPTPRNQSYQAKPKG